MRIPFPERISFFHASIFAFVLAILQLLAHTDPTFSILCFCFILLSVVAFNIAGGFTRTTGSYVFFFATLAAIVGLVVKVVLWEPADSRLRNPTLTMANYLVGMAGLTVAVYLSRRFARNKGFLQETLKSQNIRAAAIGCVVVGIGLPFLGALASSGGESLLTPLIAASSQLNRFLNMAIILGVTYEINSTNGRRSINATILVAAFFIFFQGAILGFSKEALFSGPICWLATGAALRYRFNRYQILGGIAVVLFFVQYMVPYCQYGRNFREGGITYTQNVSLSVDLLSRLGEIRRIYNADQATIDRGSTLDYFGTPQGLLDRLQMISMDDALNDVTRQNGPLGLRSVWLSFQNAVPRAFWKDKPNVNMANYYGHEVGVIASDDDATDISFSPVGEAYHLGTWVGLLLVAPLIWFLLFIIIDSLCGDLRKSPWGILALASYAHIAPEGGISGMIYFMTYGAFVIIFVAFFSAYVMPLVASLASPPQRDTGRGGSFHRPRTRQPVPPVISES